MTIQPSVLVWTVICFCLLWLILRNLLFRPMLRFMDERNARIARAEAKKHADEQRLAEAEAAEAEARAAAEAERAEARKKNRAEAEHAAAASVAEAQKAAFAEKEACRAVLADEKVTVSEALDARLDALAKAFADQMLS